MTRNRSFADPMQPAARITALLRRMHAIVANDATPQERLDELTRAIAQHVSADVCSIYIRQPDESLELYSTLGLKREAVHSTVLAWGEGLVGQVCVTQRPLVTADAPLHPAFAYRPETGEDPLHSFLGVPLLRSGKALGVLVLQNKKSRRYSDDEIEAVQAVATLLAEIAASGELLDETATRDVDEILHLPERLSGAAVVPGVAIGTVAFHEAPAPRHRVFSRNRAEDIKRLDAALEALLASVDDMLARSKLEADSREVLEAYRLFANDRGWHDRLRSAVQSGLTAESAVERVQGENRTRMSEARSPYLRERLHDLDDLSYRLLRHLTAGPIHTEALQEDAIVLARTMGPADLLEYDRDKIKGLVLAEASPTSHVAIVARAIGVPLVSGIGEALALAESGDAIAIDGDTGEVFIRPTEDVVSSFSQKRELQSERQAAFARERDLPAQTHDGVEIEILINAGLALDMAHLSATGAAGVGLFRTELQFLIGTQLPRVSAQQKLYHDVLELSTDKPVVFRTADLGGDKSADYMEREHEGNPAMGWRGLRMAVDRPGIIRPQLRALLAAAVGRDLYILFPMVTLGSEMSVARALLDKEIDIRRQRGQPLPRDIKVGAMIETPSSVWRIDEIARQADFLSVGGNDLAQFYFAADRNSAQTQRRYDPLEWGFLNFLKRAVEGADAAGRPISFCGEQAADCVFAAALIAIGLRRFSIPPTAVGAFRRFVRSVSVEELRDWFQNAGAAASENMRRDLSIFLRGRGAAIE